MCQINQCTTLIIFHAIKLSCAPGCFYRMADVITRLLFLLLYLKTFYNVLNDDEDDIPQEMLFCFDTDAVISFVAGKAT